MSSSTSSSSSLTSKKVLQESLFLPPSIVEKLEAGAFRSLCHHLQERSEEVPNIDLMTLSGFCRNCLAKASMENRVVCWLDLPACLFGVRY